MGRNLVSNHALTEQSLEVQEVRHGRLTSCADPPQDEPRKTANPNIELSCAAAVSSPRPTEETHFPHHAAAKASTPTICYVHLVAILQLNQIGHWTHSVGIVSNVYAKTSQA